MFNFMRKKSGKTVSHHFSKAFSLTTNSLESIFPKTNFSIVIISPFSLILSKTNFSEGKFYDIFTLAAMDRK